MDIYIYIEKKVFYNIEGQLRGLPRINLAKTCAPHLYSVNKSAQLFLYSREARKSSLPAKTPTPLPEPPATPLKKIS
jgi:hypothetical protein